MREQIISRFQDAGAKNSRILDAGEALPGGCSGNTHPANRHLETGGEDTAVLSLGVQWRVDGEGLLASLERAKEKARAAHEMVPFAHDGRLFGVHPGGKATGGGSGTYYRYRLESGGYQFQLTQQTAPVELTPNVMVDIGSSVLMAAGGLGNAWGEIKNILESLGGYVMWSKVQRIDLCADLPGLDVSDIVDLIRQRQSIGRASKRQYFEDGDRWTGVTIGRGDIIARIYDKAYEVQVDRPDAFKEHLLEEQRWGGPQTVATRVEFQLRREAIKSFGIDSIGDYFGKRAGLLAYLTSQWFRLVDAVPDRENNNTTRAGTHPLWSRVGDAFQAWAGATKEAARRVGRRLYRDPIRLLKQSLGCLMSAVSDLVEGQDLQSSEFVTKAVDCLGFVMRMMPEWQFQERYKSKALPLLVSRAT